jgi:hypothetical protein
VEASDTEFVLVGDDDFRYGPTAIVDQMTAFLRHHAEFDLIGGRITEGGKLKDYQGFMKIVGRQLRETPLDLADVQHEEIIGEYSLGYAPCDLTFNYFVARRDKLLATPWDEKIKVTYEHDSWFLDFKAAGGKVAFSPEPIVEHKPSDIERRISPSYGGYRMRQDDIAYFFKKHELDSFRDFRGNIRTAPVPTEKPPRLSPVKDVDFLVTAMMRRSVLERLLTSIARHYPWANIYVADQSFTSAYWRGLKEILAKKGLKSRVIVFPMPDDCGVSACRNLLAERSPNKYKLILDDDFEFTEQTDIGKMVMLMEAIPECGVVGGRVTQTGVDIHFEHCLEIKDGTVLHVPDGDRWRTVAGMRAKKTGCVLNFALFRREAIAAVGWDEGQKVCEHTDFYLRWKGTPYQAWYLPEVAVDHPPHEREPEYKERRTRQEFLARFLRKYGAKRMKYLNGQVSELMPDGSIRRYKEN